MMDWWNERHTYLQMVCIRESCLPSLERAVQIDCGQIQVFSYPCGGWQHDCRAGVLCLQHPNAQLNSLYSAKERSDNTQAARRHTAT